MADTNREVANLVEGDLFQEIPLHLWSDLTAWRQRAIERINLSSALWVERQRSIQVMRLRKQIEDAVRKHPVRGEVARRSHARLILPIGRFLRTLRLNLNVTVDEEIAYPVSREEQVRLELDYFERRASLVNDSLGISLDKRLRADNEALRRFLRCLLIYRPWLWNRYRTRWMNRLQYDSSCGYISYLRGTMPLPDDFDQWKKEVRLIRNTITKYSPADRVSAMENPLLALPLIIGREGGWSTGDVLNLLDKLKTFLKEAEFADEGEALLKSYASLGSYRTLLAECEVPLDQPFMITVEERQPFSFGRVLPGGTIDFERSGHISPKVRLLLSFKEAASTYVNIRVPDMNVEIARNSWSVRNDRNSEAEELDEVTQTKSTEILAFHSLRRNRSEKVWLTFRLRQTFSIRITLIVVWFALGITMGTLWQLGARHTLRMTDMAGLLFPASIAASLLLTRGNTSLGMRINRVWHTITAFLIAVLMVLVAWLFFHDTSATKDDVGAPYRSYVTGNSY